MFFRIFLYMKVQPELLDKMKFKVGHEQTTTRNNNGRHKIHALKMEDERNQESI